MDRNLKNQLVVFTSNNIGDLKYSFDKVENIHQFTPVAITLIQQFIEECSPRTDRGRQADIQNILYGDLGELLVYFMFTINGYNVTKPLPDYGVDFLAEKDGEKLAIQVKLRSNPDHQFDYISDGIDSFVKECNSKYKKKDGWKKVVISNTNSCLVKTGITWYSSIFLNEKMDGQWNNFSSLFQSLWS